MKFELLAILVEHSSYTVTYRLKSRLIAAGLLRETCYECGIGPEWNGKRLTLQLDHENGVNDDNRLSNLRILCPNCHSQTSTYAGLNNRVYPIDHWCECGARITRQAVTGKCKRCSQQVRIASRVKYGTLAWPPLDELLKIKARRGIEALGRELGVSGTAIHKRITKSLKRTA